MARVFPFILKAKDKTLHIIWAWAWIGKFYRKTICTSFDQSSLIFDRSSFTDLHIKSYTTLHSNFTHFVPKSQWLVHQIEISKILDINLKKRCIGQNDQMLRIVKKPNEKLQRYVIIFLWEVIYVYFYNWDRPLDLVLIVYDLIELIIEASL